MIPFMISPVRLSLPWPPWVFAKRTLALLRGELYHLFS